MKDSLHNVECLLYIYELTYYVICDNIIQKIYSICGIHISALQINTT